MTEITVIGSSYVKCKKCGTLKMKWKRCPECRKWEVQRIEEISRLRDDHKTFKITESNVFSPKKCPTNNIVDKFDRQKTCIKIGSKINRRGEWSNIVMSLDNPYTLIFCNVGGIHRINIAYSSPELQEYINRWKEAYYGLFGVRPWVRGLKSKRKYWKKMKELERQTRVEKAFGSEE